LAGARAGGGPVVGGRDYLVGEKGPEVFTPNMSGSIIANDNLSGGLNRVEIVPSPWFDVRAATAAEPSIRQMGVRAAAGGASIAQEQGRRARRRSLVRG
jgi:hypothetical protein